MLVRMRDSLIRSVVTYHFGGCVGGLRRLVECRLPKLKLKTHWKKLRRKTIAPSGRNHVMHNLIGPNYPDLWLLWENTRPPPRHGRPEYRPPLIGSRPTCQWTWQQTDVGAEEDTSTVPSQRFQAYRCRVETRTTKFPPHHILTISHSTTQHGDRTAPRHLAPPHPHRSLHLPSQHCRGRQGTQDHAQGVL